MDKKIGRELDVVTEPDTNHRQPINTLQRMNAPESSFSSSDLENQAPMKKIKPNKDV